MEILREKAQQIDDPFSKLFLSELPWLCSCITWVLERPPHTALGELMEKSKRNPLLRHLDKGSIALAMVDISHFITWTIHNFRSWSADKMNLILTAYQQVWRLSTEERELILTGQISPRMTLALAQWHFEKKYTRTHSKGLSVA